MFGWMPDYLEKTCCYSRYCISQFVNHIILLFKGKGNRIVYITAIIIYKIMKKLLDSDWLRAVQFK